jgi:type IV pilus assembly protein PilX
MTVHAMRNPLPSRERGVVLIFTLIILLILTISAVALVRSMHTSLFSGGNLAFRRDLVNQGEQAVSNVMTQFKTGIFSTSVSTQADDAAANYSSTMLATNAQGVPLALLNSTAFGAVGVAANDIAGATPDISIRYVIDRLCSQTGPPVGSVCVQSTAVSPGQTAYINTGLPPPSATVYRLSVRVSGPRSTQIFLQTTFTKPD